tara:strand:+ start:505 stop:933 length:429 start_codon:yes stop_codon:yes gene_type:complete
MRYFVADPRAVTMDDLRAAFQSVDAKYDLLCEGSIGELLFDGGLYGQVEFNIPGDGLFDAEIQEHVENAQYQGTGQVDRVVDLLRSAKATVCVQVLNQGRDSDSTLARIAPLWEWLFLNRLGLLHAGGEGYYDEDNLIVEAD